MANSRRDKVQTMTTTLHNRRRVLPNSRPSPPAFCRVKKPAGELSAAGRRVERGRRGFAANMKWHLAAEAKVEDRVESSPVCGRSVASDNAGHRGSFHASDTVRNSLYIREGV